ncbi:MAG: hypothetical protein JNJ85_08485, partial [Candidatus Kapabacteria bacterium]|nr:hypothetical protein [Candidatus Kapabacteria bacterium]
MKYKVWSHTKMRAYSVKFVSCLLVCIFSLEFLTPVYVYCAGSSTQGEHTASPNQSNNMVNPFDGSFSYSIPILTVPGPNGSDFPVTLTYNSKYIKPENDATWVGFGWSLDVGAINREQIGIADDMSGEPIMYTTKTKPNITVALRYPLNLSESFDFKSSPGGWNADFTLRYNNQRGYDLIYGVNAQISNWGSLGLHVSDEGLNYNVGIGIPLNVALGSTNVPMFNTLCIDGMEQVDYCGDVAVEDNLALGQIGAGYSGSLYSINEKNYSTRVGDFEGSTTIIPVGYHTTQKLLIGSKEELTTTLTSSSAIENQHSDGYGLLYNGNRYNSYPDGTYKDGTEGDILTEKEKSVNTKRLKFLPLTFNAGDNFNVSTPGISGVFKLIQKNIGQQSVKSSNGKILIKHMGGDWIQKQQQNAYYQAQGAGLHAGLGESVSKMDGYGIDKGYSFLPDNDMMLMPDAITNIKTWQYANGNSQQFRFIGDKGGYVKYATSTQPTCSYSSDGNIDRSTLNPEVNNGLGVRTSNAIEYHTISQIQKKKNNKNIGSFMKSSPINSQYFSPVDDIESSGILPLDGNDKVPTTETQKINKVYKNSIGEFCITNSNGQKYCYGLPVYQRCETNVRYGTKSWNAVVPSDLLQVSGSSKYPNSTECKNYIIKSDQLQNQSKSKSTIIEQKPTPKATQYLLTLITSNDYVDKSLDGPTPDDYGTYVKFEYEKITGLKLIGDYVEDRGWYKWRAPYYGYYYQKGLHSDNNDDFGTASFGEREIYYLKTITTKTHTAVFELNNTVSEPRLDAISALMNEKEAGAGNSSNVSSCMKQRYLKSVTLYTNEQYQAYLSSGQNNWISRTNLSYDYSLCKGILNAIGNNTGKLTLRKLWTDYNNVVQSTYSPYTFNYVYPSANSISTNGFPAEYNNIIGYGSSLTQNPNYNVFNTDRWGNYQNDGGDRKANYNYWNNQNPNPSFDAGAWMLKHIILPSGGSIIVQYEQNEYLYVQDKRAEVMAPIKHISGTRHFLNVEQLGITTLQEKQELLSLLNKQFISNKERLYFKFLYKLYDIGWAGGFPSDDNCGMEYINGYSNVKSCGIANVDIGGNTQQEIYIEFEEQYPRAPNFLGLPVYPMLISQPNKAAMDFKYTHNSQFIDRKNCDEVGTLNGDNYQDVEGVVKNIDMIVESILRNTPNLINTFNSIFSTKLDELISNSFVRIPALRAKKGGGARVKRVITYAPTYNLDGSGKDNYIQGVEYHYQTLDNGRIVSSGVATNEPKTGGDENTLVCIINEFEDGNTEGM